MPEGQTPELTQSGDQSNKVSVSVNADRLINTRLSLKDVLGDNWQDNCIFASLDQALTPEEARMIKTAQEVKPDQVHTKTEVFVATANQIFTENQSTYHARLLTREDGEQEILITGNIARDLVYQIIEKRFMVYQTKAGQNCIAWISEKMGLVDTEGEVFSIDRLLRNGKYSQKDYNLEFIEKAGGRSSANEQFSRDTKLGTITPIPRNWDELGEFTHELGHLLRNRRINEKTELRKAASEAHDSFKTISETEKTHHPKASLNNYQIRQLKVATERGAWAIGLAILREVGTRTKLDCTSKQAMLRMCGRTHKALQTYDTVPYSFEGQKENKPVPAFSNETRKASGELHRLMKKLTLKYSELPSFDQYTGESLANNPQETIKRLQPDAFGKEKV